MAPSRDDRLRVVVLGYLVRGPLGGMAWHYLQYAMGLQQLGHDVHYLEDSDDVPWSCYDPVRGLVDEDPSYGLGFAKAAFDRVGLPDRWAYHDAHRDRWLGPAAERALNVCATADLLVNVSGSNPLRPWMTDIPRRAFVDTDPAFTQVRHLTDEERRARAALHTDFFTFGGNVGREGVHIPDDGFDWHPTRQPLVLDAWPVTPGPADGPFTTVMQWESYPALEHGGRRLGMKSESFAPFLDLPSKANGSFELALGGREAPRASLREHGWLVRDPLELARDPWTYQEYLASSKAEFAVAKHGYAASRSGWFSERSAGYLASGRPVVVQDTGFTDWMTAREGVLPFTDPDEAVGAIEEVGARYERHSRAARAVAEEWFDARRVLSELLEAAMATSVERR